MMSNGRQASPLTSRELTEACTCLTAVASSTTAGLRAANGFTRATIILRRVEPPQRPHQRRRKLLKAFAMGAKNYGTAYNPLAFAVLAG